MSILASTPIAEHPGFGLAELMAAPVETMLTVDVLLQSFEQSDAIREQARRGSARRASVMLTEMLASPDVQPEHAAWAATIQAQARSSDGSARTAEDILRKMVAAGRTDPDCRPTTVVVNAALDCHAKCPDGSARAAQALFRAMADEVQLDTISYNTLINCFAKCRDGSAAGAAETLAAMQAAGVRPSAVSYHSLLSALTRQPDGSAAAAARATYEMARDHAEHNGPAPDLSIFSAAINFQSKARDGSGREALRLLAAMRPAGVAPTAVTLNAVIDAQAKNRDGSAQVAVTILDAMRRSQDSKVRPTVVTYTSVLDCHAKCADGDGRTAVALLEEMAAEQIEPNHMTFGCAINAQAKRGTARMASTLLDKMKARGVRASHVQYNAVIDAHAKCSDGSAAVALELLAEMEAAGPGCAPNVVSYSGCIDAQTRQPDGSAVTAAELLKAMIEAGIRPDHATFAGVIDAQSKRRDGSAAAAAATLSQMRAYSSPSQALYNSVLNACAAHRPADVELASRILAELLAHGFRPNSYTLSALLRCAGFASGGKPELARQWFAEYAATAPAQINEHVGRALRTAVPDREADELLASAGAPPHTGRTRSSSRHGSSDTSPPLARRSSRASVLSFGSSPESSPPSVRRGSASPPSRRGSSSPPMNRRRSSMAEWRAQQHDQEQPMDGSRPQQSHPRPSLQSDWRAFNPDNGPSSRLFTSGRRTSITSMTQLDQPTSQQLGITTNGGGNGAAPSHRRTSLSRPPALSLSTKGSAPGHGLGDSDRSGLLSPRGSVGNLLSPRSSVPELSSPCDLLSPTFVTFAQKGPRLSLVDKIAKIKGGAKPAEQSPLTPAQEGSGQRKPSVLLSPEFFTESPPSPSADEMRQPTRRMSRRASGCSMVLREPEGPDGTRGFCKRRSSIFVTQQQSPARTETVVG